MAKHRGQISANKKKRKIKKRNGR